MTNTVSVGTRYDSATVVVPAAVSLLTGGFAAVYWLLGGVPVLLTLWAAVAAACGRYAGLELWRVYRGRRWLRPTATGFEVIDRRGATEYPDAVVVASAVWHSTVFNNGRPYRRRVTGSLTVITQDGVRGVALDYSYGLVELDPLGRLLGRLSDRLLAQADSQLQVGGRLVGDGWSFGHDGLTVDDGPGHLLSADIAAVRAVDGAVCVWRVGADRPAVRLPVESANVGVLVALLGRVVPAVDVPTSHLGRELFRRDASVRGWGRVRAAAGLGCFLACGGLGAVAAFSGGFLAVGATLAVLCLAPTVVAVHSVWRRRVDIFRCHELGVARDRPGRTDSLRYDACVGFQFATTPEYSFGQYQGTSYALQFWPADPSDGPSVAFSWASSQPDPAAESVRDLVSRVLADRVLSRLAAGEVVPWTVELTFHPSGLAVGRGRMVPYSDLSRFELADGACRVYGANDRRPLAEVQMSERNAYPGLVVLQRLSHTE